MKRFITTVFSLLIIIAAVFSTGAYTDSVSDTLKEVTSVAQSSFITVKSIFSADYESWGFSSPAEVRSLELGANYPVWYPDEAKLQSAKGNSISDYIDKNREVWLFTLDSEGKTLGFMWIIKENDEYTLARYSGPDQVYLDLKLTAEKIAKENNLSILPVFFNNFGTLNFVLQSGSDEYILPVETTALSRSTTDYKLSSTIVKEDKGYLLDSKEFTDRLKVMYTPSNETIKTEDLKYSGVSIYNFTTESSEKINAKTIIIVTSITLVLATVVTGAVFYLRKKATKNA